MKKQGSLFGDAASGPGCPPVAVAPSLRDQGAPIHIAPPHRLELVLYGSDGVEIKVGDTVKITNTHCSPFYSTVQVMPNGALWPFATFSYHRIVKCDKVPETAQLMRKDRGDEPDGWYDVGGPEDDLYDNAIAEWKRESMEFDGQHFYRVQQRNN